MLRSAIGIIGLAVGLAVGGGTSAAADVAIVADHIVAPDGSLISGKAVVIRDGAIHRIVDAADVREDVEMIRHEGAVLSPGLIDVASSVGVHRSNEARLDPIDPSISAVDALDPYADQLSAALAAGITALHVIPDPTNLIAGATAVVRTTGDVLDADGPMLVSIGSAVLDPAREPSSRAGALRMLRLAIAADDAHPRLREVADGKRAVVCACEQARDVDASLRIFSRYEIAPVILIGDDAADVAETLADAGSPVVLGPLLPSSSLRSLRGPAACEAAGVPVAFSGGLPARDPIALRVTASMAVRHGMSPEAARRGLTVEAARVAGVADRVGSIERGRAADLVVFSGDPLRLDARVLEVYVNGERVHVAGTGGR